MYLQAPESPRYFAFDQALAALKPNPNPNPNVYLQAVALEAALWRGRHEQGRALREGQVVHLWGWVRSGVQVGRLVSPGLGRG